MTKSDDLRIPDLKNGISDFNSESYLHNEFIKIYSELYVKVTGLNKSANNLKVECVEFIDDYSTNEEIEDDPSGFKRDSDIIMNKISFIEKSYGELVKKINEKYYDDVMDAYSFDEKLDPEFYLKIMQTMYDLILMSEVQMDWASKIRDKIKTICTDLFGEQ